MRDSLTVLRLSCWFLLLVMPPVAVLSFRSGDHRLSAMAIGMCGFAVFHLSPGGRSRSLPARVIGVTLAAVLVVLAILALLRGD